MIRRRATAFPEEQEEERVPEPIVDGDGVVCIQPLRMVPPEVDVVNLE